MSYNCNEEVEVLYAPQAIGQGGCNAMGTGGAVVEGRRKDCDCTGGIVVIGGGIGVDRQQQARARTATRGGSVVYPSWAIYTGFHCKC